MTDRVRKISAAFLVSAAIGLFFIYALLKLDYHWQWPVLLTTRYKFFMGFLVTLAISFFSLILSLLLGILAAAGAAANPCFSDISRRSTLS